MSGLTPKLPIVLDPDNGFMLIKTFRELAIQNLKNVLLTSPGERVMDPEFGCGIRKYLFQQNHETTYLEIEGRIQNQVVKYLPFIALMGITFSSPTVGEDHNPGAGHGDRGSSILDGNFLGIEIKFKVIPLGVNETLNLP